MNIKRKVMAYMEEHPQATTDDLRNAFPDANKKSLWNYSGQWKKQKGMKKIEKSKSVRKQIFDFLNQKNDASLSDLKKAFPDANQVSISNYRYQWKKQKSDVAKKQSVKDQVYSYLDSNPDASFGELRRILSHLNPSSVSAYHSQWKQQGEEGNLFTPHKKPTEKTGNRKSKAKGGEKALVEALRATIEAQKVTIEAMRKQNSLLKEKQSAVANELEGLNDLQLDEIKRIMSTYIKGMRKL